MQRRLRNRARARRWPLMWPLMWALSAVVAISWAMALPAAAQRVDSDLKAAWQDIEAWDLRGARARLEDLKKARTGTDPLVARLAAQVLFEEGRLDEAVAALDAVGPAVDEGDEIARLIRDTRTITRRYATVESAHFRLRFPPGKDALIAPYALETLESIRAALEADLGHAPPGKVIVEIYETAEALSKVSTLPLSAIRTTGTVAICKFNKLMITSPKALLQGYEWRDTLAHEYVHLVVSQMSRNRVPIWVHEGLAKFYETRWDGDAGRGLSPASAAFLFQEQKKGKLIPFEKMHPSLALLPSQDEAALAYAEAFSAIEFLHARGSNAMIARLIGAFGQGRDDREAIREATGASFQSFLRDWKRYLAKRPAPREALPLAAERKRFADEREKTPGDENALPEDKKLRVGDFLDIGDEEARRRAHLGELLRARSRNKAAIEEFKKAHAIVGDRSPMLSLRFAQASRAVGDDKRAEALLKSSLKLFPGLPQTNLALGELYFEGGRLLEARARFIAVIGVDPFDPKPHERLIDIYRSLSQAALEAQAREALKLITGQAPDLASPASAQAGTPATPTEEARSAIVAIESHPFGQIEIDGAPTGRSTPTKIELSAGRHRVRVVNAERDFVREVEVELRPGETRSLRFEP